MKILLTGVAGFIGSHTLDRLIEDGHNIVGIDNFDPFYPRGLKESNLASAIDKVEDDDCLGSFQLLEADLAESSTYDKIESLIGDEPIDAIIHLAARAGVRPSIEDPVGYQRANVIATQNLLEFATVGKPPFRATPSTPASRKNQITLPNNRNQGLAESTV